MSLALHRRIPGLRSPFLKLDAARAKRDTALAERNAAVAERDTALAERNAAGTERDTALAERNAAVAERDTALAERNAAVAKYDAALAERNAAVAKYDAALAERNLFDLKQNYERLVAYCKDQAPLDEAMRSVVGGDFDLIGNIECGILQHYGLEPTHYLIDVGCGSGRLAKPLSSYFAGRYLGTDLVRDLVDYARHLVNQPDWRFEVVDDIGIPEQAGVANMVCFFSVLTHLLPEQSYWYLDEAKRVLKPGGKILFSFLEFRHPGHWPIFESTLHEARTIRMHPLNVFIAREAIHVWAEHLGLTIEDLRDASDPVVPQGALGQSICVMRVPV